MRYNKLQDLPPGWARFCLNIQAVMEDLVQEKIKGRTVLVSLSGGPDSTALLLALHYIRPRTGINIFAAHLNHMLRPAADKEEDFTGNLCARLAIPLEHGKKDVTLFAQTGKMGIEEAARTLRYDFIQKAADRLGADYILTGHHLNDLAEDMLMRLSRGAVWPGLSGMSGYDPDRKLVRPLLLTPRKTILEFLDAIGQDYMLDESNEDKSFLRNRIRLDLVPVFEAINPGFLSSAANLWKLGRIDEDHFKSILRAVPITERNQGKHVCFEDLESLSKASRLRLYKKLLDELGPGQVLFDNLNELDRLWQEGNGGKTVQFPGDKFGMIDHKGILFGIRGLGEERLRD
jgi:tRNA(Ile)-lysidine synthase